MSSWNLWLVRPYLEFSEFVLDAILNWSGRHFKSSTLCNEQASFFFTERCRKRVLQMRTPSGSHFLHLSPYWPLKPRLAPWGASRALAAPWGLVWGRGRALTCSLALDHLAVVLQHMLEVGIASQVLYIWNLYSIIYILFCFVWLLLFCCIVQTTYPRLLLLFFWWLAWQANRLL